jgi:hypothetical protein
VPEFLSEPSVEIARRLDVRGENAWLALLMPAADPNAVLDGFRAELSSLLERPSRVLNLRDNTFEQLRDRLHQPHDDIVILSASRDLEPEMWSSLDMMRSALERSGPVIFWINADAVSRLSEFAPNIRSFIGPSIFVAGPEGGIITEAERQDRLQELAKQYGLSNEEVIRKAQSNELPPEPHFVEWVVLLGRGDLV